MIVNEYWLKFSPIDKNWFMGVGLLHVIIGLFGLIVNLLVLIYLLKIKIKKTPSSYLLINLSLADLLKISIDLPMVVMSTLYGGWLFGKIGCDFYVILSGLQGFTTIFTLMFMSIERYLVVKYPLYSLKISKRVVISSSIMTWVCALIIILPQTYSTNGFILEGLLTSCTFDYLSRDIKSRMLLLYMVLFGFFIPLIVIVIFYMHLCLHLRNKSIENYRIVYKNKHDLKLNLEFRSKPKPLSEEIKFIFNKNELSAKMLADTDRNLRLSNKNYLINREIKVAKIILLKVALFTFAWSPYLIMAFIAQFSENLEKYVTPYTTTLPALFAKSSIIYNALVYTLTQRDCRNYFNNLFLNRKRRNAW